MAYFQTATKVSKLLEKQELMCLLGDPKLKDITTVTVSILVGSSAVFAASVTSCAHFM